MKIIDYGNNKAYEFKNEGSDILAIIIEGSGFFSVLGWEENNQFKKGGLWFYLLELFKDDCSVLVLEKLNFEFGKNYEYDINFRRTYTLENLIKSYSETINKYLSENSYSKVVLLGCSEGACVLPRVFKNISNKNMISGMVSMEYGGLSRYQQLKILANSQLKGINDLTKEVFNNIDLYKKDINLYPNSIGTFVAYPYAWWNSILDYMPFNDYKEINIPVLFIHGELDINVPVESTKYIQDNLQNKPFEYLIYPDADHGSFMYSEKTFYDLVTRSREWLKKL
jgi:esterase/lipase